MTRERVSLRGLLERLDITEVRELFGEQWYIFRTDDRWCAIRRGGGIFALDGPASLLQHCVRAERVADFAGQLCLQEFLSMLTEDQLAQVYAAGGIPDGLFENCVMGEP